MKKHYQFVCLVVFDLYEKGLFLGAKNPYFIDLGLKNSNSRGDA